MEPLEYPEQFACILHVKSRAIISHKKSAFRFSGKSKFNPGGFVFAGKLPCIAHQIVQSNSQQSLISIHSQVWPNNEFHGSLGLSFADVRYQALSQQTKIDGLPHQFTAT